MTQQELKDRLQDITGFSDFQLTFVNVYHPNNYGDYFLEDNHIMLYILDRDGSQLAREVLEREALHEMAHHLQIRHTQGYRLRSSTAHGRTFKRQFTKLLKKYYNNRVPQDTLEYLKDGGILDVEVENAETS